MIRKKNLVYLGLLLGLLTLPPWNFSIAGEANVFQDDDDAVTSEGEDDSFAEKMIHFLGRRNCAGDDGAVASDLENRLSSCTAIYRDKSDPKVRRDSGVSFPVYQSCIHEIAENFEKIGNVSCKEKYIKTLLNTQSGMIYNRIRTLRPGAAPLIVNPEDLKELFTLVNLWLSDIRRTLLGGTQSEGYRKVLKKRLKLAPAGLVAKKVELTARVFLGQIVALTQEHPEYLLQERSFLVGLESASQILETARATQLDPQFLFPILAQLLIPLHQRLDLMTDIHDFQCELKDCSRESAEHTELSRTIEALAGLDAVTPPKSPEIATPTGSKKKGKKTLAVGKSKNARQEYANNEPLTVQNKELHRFLAALFEAKGMVVEAETRLLLDLPGDQVTTKRKWLISSIAEGNFPSYYQEYSSLVSAFSEWFNNYRYTGFFKKQKMSDLDFGLTPENISAAKSQMETVLERLKNERAKYKEISADNHDLLKNQINLSSEREQLADLSQDIRSAQANLRDKDDRFARYTQSAFRLLNSPKWRGTEGKSLLAQSDHRLSISGSDARYEDEFFKAKKHRIQDIAVHQEQFSSVAGEERDIVTLEVNGKWSPRCALGQSQFAQGKNGMSTVLVGPEGFTQTDVSSDSQVESSNDYRSSRGFHSDTHSDTKSNTVAESISTDLSLEIPIVSKFLFFGASASASATHSETHSSSDVRGNEDSWGKNLSSTTSGEKRRSASFELGLRLPHTPFPDMPAGSLLLVQMKRGSSEMKDVIDVQVVRGYTTHVLKQAGDLYLVANDCKRQDAEKLSVHLTLQRPLSRELKQVSEAMLESAKTISEEGIQYIRAGAISGSQVEALRKKALRPILLEGVDPHQMGLLNQLYEGWIAEELAQLESKIRILNSERQLRVVAHRAEDLNEDLRYLRTKQNVGSFSSLWSYDNRDIVYLGAHLNRSIQFFRHRLLPIIKLRHPSVVAQLMLSQKHKFEELTSALSIDHSIAVITDKFLPLYSETENLIQNRTLADNLIQLERPVMISFPRVVNEGQDHSLIPQEVEDHTDIPQSSFMTALQPWEAFAESLMRTPAGSSVELVKSYLKRSQGILKVTPQDLYVSRQGIVNGTLRNAKIEGSLPCNAAAPIIDAMAIYFNLKKDPDGAEARTLSEAFHTINVEMISNPQFPDETGNHEYTLTKNWTTLHVPVIYGDSGTPGKIFIDHHIGQERIGKGISPFGEFKINFNEFNFSQSRLLQGVDQQITDVMLVFKVAYRSADHDLTWLEQCRGLGHLAKASKGTRAVASESAKVHAKPPRGSLRGTVLKK